jgi:hypothetical protein
MIIAIEDRLANDVAGAFVVFKADAPAIRFFGDVIENNPALKSHIEDYQLVQYGVLDDDMTIISERRIIISGAAYHAAQEKFLQAQQAATEAR